MEIDMTIHDIISDYDGITLIGQKGERIKILLTEQEVKVLKKGYSNDYDVLAGVITEFVNFKELPTMIVAVFKQDYSGCHLEFINYNAKTEGVEITPCCEHELKLEKCRVVDKFNQEIEKKKAEMDELTAKRDYFEKYFQKYFK